MGDNERNRPRFFSSTMTTASPGMTRDEAYALFERQMEGVNKNNEGNKAYQEGRFEDAVRLHREALAFKLGQHDKDSIQVALTHNALGEALLKAGELDEADELFEKAIRVREREATKYRAEEKSGADALELDAAATRENIGALREAQGRFEEARTIRLEGAAKGGILCSNAKCPQVGPLALSELNACGACKAPFYCSKRCQKADWKERHKPLCKKAMAGGGSS
ncbi:hypothetical protein F5Y18DRAFT_321557 [Xylariaceae sp. FL1019]|nr:hypothetical protein F5Y18DRAFT_321557 [Xylariaceae sp. FL1019]